MTAPKIKAGDRIQHDKFGIGTVVGLWEDEDEEDVSTNVWAVMFDDESLANEHLRACGQPALQGKPFPIVPALEPDAYRVIREDKSS